MSKNSRPWPRTLAALTALVVLLAATMHPRTSSFAQGAIDPAEFALAPDDFPAGSQILDSRVVDNFLVDAQHLQIGPSLPAGRLTGYFMQGRALDGSGSIRISASYLVSIFSDIDAATGADTQQNDFWQALAQTSPTIVEVNSAPGSVGDPGSQHWYALHDANGRTHSELFFRRGRVFIEVNLDSGAGSFTSVDTDAFLRMATLLDATAVQGRQVKTVTPSPFVTATRTTTDTPTPTATTTPTSTPTLTPTRTATAIPAAKPVRERQKRCKKGFHRVNGKCRKKK